MKYTNSYTTNIKVGYKLKNKSACKNVHSTNIILATKREGKQNTNICAIVK